MSEKKLDPIVGNVLEREVTYSGGDFIAESVEIWIKDQSLRDEIAAKIASGESVKLDIKKAKDRTAVKKQDGTLIPNLYKTGFVTYYQKPADLPF